MTARTNVSYSLDPPPRMSPLGELPAVIEPRLTDLTPFPGAPVQDWAPFQSAPGDARTTSEMRRRAHEVALRDERVIRLLDGKRHRAIGASVLEKRRSEETLILLVFYNYTDDVVVEATLDGAGTAVSHVSVLHYQPAPTEEEIAEVVALARKDARIADKIEEGMEGGAILLSTTDLRPSRPFHRIFDVGFTFPDRRLPALKAIVNASTGAVLRAGLCCKDPSSRRGGAS